MHLSVTMYSFNIWARKGKIDVKGFIEYCGTLEGVEAVDLLPYYWTDEEKERPMVKKWLADNGLKIACYAIGNNFAHENGEELEKQIKAAKRGIDVAAELGAPCIRIFGGSLERKTGDRFHDPSDGVFGCTLSEDKTRQDAVGICIDAVAKLVDYAEEKDVILAVENHDGIPKTIAECERFREEIKSPYLKFNLDNGNFLTNGVDPVKAFSILANSAAHAHIKDAKKAPEGSRQPYEQCVIGEGVIDSIGCISKLKEAGYKGYCSIECEKEKGDLRENVRKSVKYIRSLGL
jgi:sugar phosphate isomerase/epimerase